MNDLISKRDAITSMSDLICNLHGKVPVFNEVYHAIYDIPSAEPERKKGHWVKVYGYFTPGGDPVWKCSECGKGIHVYGIEANTYNRDYTDGHQWVACPNCGARMEIGNENVE